MHLMRESWTDARLDDLNGKVDVLSHRMEARFVRVEGRIDDLHRTIHRTMLQLGAGMIVTLGIGFAGIIVTQL